MKPLMISPTYFCHFSILMQVIVEDVTYAGTAAGNGPSSIAAAALHATVADEEGSFPDTPNNRIVESPQAAAAAEETVIASISKRTAKIVEAADNNLEGKSYICHHVQQAL